MPTIREDLVRVVWKCVNFWFTCADHQNKNLRLNEIPLLIFFSNFNAKQTGTN